MCLFLVNIYFLFFLGPIYNCSFPQSIYFVLLFLLLHLRQCTSFLMVRHVISVFVEFVGTYLYFFTYSVTNILHVTVFSSQNFFLSFKTNTLKLTFMNQWPLPKNLSAFFKNLFSILYHGRRSVTVHLSRVKVTFFFLTFSLF